MKAQMKVSVWIGVRSDGVPIYETTERSENYCRDIIQATRRQDDGLIVTPAILSFPWPPLKSKPRRYRVEKEAR